MNQRTFLMAGWIGGDDRFGVDGRSDSRDASREGR